MSIQRALFACVGGTSYYDLGREKILFRDLFDICRDLLKQRLDGLWLSRMFLPSRLLSSKILTERPDCKSNVAIIGSFIITALLSSTDDETYQSRHALLDEFRHVLYALAERFDFAALPLLRVNLLLERFTDNGSSDDEGDEGHES